LKLALVIAMAANCAKNENGKRAGRLICITFLIHARRERAVEQAVDLCILRRVLCWTFNRQEAIQQRAQIYTVI
jgi:hypothetical protein